MYLSSKKLYHLYKVSFIQQVFANHVLCWGGGGEKAKNRNSLPSWSQHSSVFCLKETKSTSNPEIFEVLSQIL